MTVSKVRPFSRVEWNLEVQNLGKTLTHFRITNPDFGSWIDITYTVVHANYWKWIDWTSSDCWGVVVEVISKFIWQVPIFNRSCSKINPFEDEISAAAKNLYDKCLFSISWTIQLTHMAGKCILAALWRVVGELRRRPVAVNVDPCRRLGKLPLWSCSVNFICRDLFACNLQAAYGKNRKLSKPYLPTLNRRLSPVLFQKINPYISHSNPDWMLYSLKSALYIEPGRYTLWTYENNAPPSVTAWEIHL